jgi:hypothetical protein
LILLHNGSDKMRMKQGNLYPLVYTLTYPDGTPINLTGTGVTVTLTMTKDGDDIPVVDKGACVLPSVLTSGVVTYNWVSGETDDAGMYVIEFLVTFADGKTLSVPSNHREWMYIIASANGGA